MVGARYEPDVGRVRSGCNPATVESIVSGSDHQNSASFSRTCFLDFMFPSSLTHLPLAEDSGF